MRSLKLTALLVIPIILAKYVFRDKVDLIDSTCKKTLYPDLCLSSLRSHPSSSAADAKMLAGIMLNLTMANATDILKEIQKLQSKATDSVIEKGLQMCYGFYYSAARDDIPNAIKYVNSGSYAIALDYVQSAIEKPHLCEQTFFQGPEIRRSPLIDRSNDVLYLTIVVQNIILGSLMQK